MTSHKKQVLSPEQRGIILGAFKSVMGDGADITPSQLEESIRFLSVSQGYPIPPQRIVNKYLRELGIKEITTKVWLLPKYSFSFKEKTNV